MSEENTNTTTEPEEHTLSEAEDVEEVNAIDVAEATLIGDLMSLVKQELQITDIWQQMSERDQGDCLDRAQRSVKHAVSKAIRIISSRDLMTAYGIVDQVVFKGGVKVVIKAANSTEALHELADREGEQVMIVMPDTDDLVNQKHDIEPDPDQGQLAGLDEEQGVDEEDDEPDPELPEAA